ncbi:MAG TPA: bifunctional ADP-dependent NAD(P)H-hydrate dehydratase/NAD(P)H-hydrate epimerase, partial [Candidatus Acetothermia bacterium]|nr:bifunctional ADP-dependent NAD(P)H-hydrate dehydratase/NAD(P)H-hydrate epimerase [Candidatus Acetothermia bacterium]
GSGDVLSGLIGGIWAGGAEALEAACVGVYLHGRSGERAAAEAPERSVLPTDLFRYIPEALRELESDLLG